MFDHRRDAVAVPLWPRRAPRPVFKRAAEFADRVALRDARGEYTYGGLLKSAAGLSAQVAGQLSGDQRRVLIVCPNDATHVIAQWACWISGQIAVPVNPQYPGYMEYYATDCDADLILTVPEHEAVVKDVAVKVGSKVHVITDADRKEALKPDDTCSTDESQKVSVEDVGHANSFYATSNALIIYTPGTSGSPKGVLLSFANLEARIQSLAQWWEMRSDDCFLHFMPLDHSQGLVDSLLCPLSLGAKCVLMKEFDPADVWVQMLAIEKSAVDCVNMLMATPSHYVRLIEKYDSSLSKSQRFVDYVRSSCSRRMRLMACSSPAVPNSMFYRWQDITGHQLLQSYSTAETGVVFSNPLHGVRTPDSTEKTRRKQEIWTTQQELKTFNREQTIKGTLIESRASSQKSSVPLSMPPGTAGLPLPAVFVQVVDETDGEVLAEGSHYGTAVMSGNRNKKPARPTFMNAGKASKVIGGGGGVDGVKDSSESAIGLLEVRGEAVFRQYWRKPKATRKEFTDSGWLKTGEIVQYRGVYSVLGQHQSDMVTTGGFRVSALQIELTLLDMPGVREAAVVALPDSTWGHKMGAMVVVKDGSGLTEKAVVDWAKGQLPEYAVPSAVRVVPDLPRNVVSGSVDKKEVVEAFAPKKANAQGEEERKQKQE
ncbi:hypothetical protein AAG570_007080 [Ranatra chinensis]|uniref:AMP-dependent synthetase/ligase domain-containing protein n=1 Tax=Ranatra chinensis TaxID=642074 RepID=A0ABD0YGN8_9HEMI